METLSKSSTQPMEKYSGKEKKTRYARYFTEKKTRNDPVASHLSQMKS